MSYEDDFSPLEADIDEEEFDPEEDFSGEEEEEEY